MFPQGDNAFMWSLMAFQARYLDCPIYLIDSDELIDSVPNEFTCNWKWFIMSLINSTTHIHVYFYICLLIL